MRMSLWIVLLLAAPSVGCAGQGAFYNWFHPGPVQQQRYRAVVHDPYPDRDIGPEVVGGRPRDFQRQLPEPVRNSYLKENFYGR